MPQDEGIAFNKTGYLWMMRSLGATAQRSTYLLSVETSRLHSERQRSDRPPFNS